MRIYIASSWKNQHGVEMLTALLRAQGHEVVSWIENNFGENHNHVTKKFPFEEWVNSPESDQSFQFDTEGATRSDLLIYYGPAGKGACAELGAAWAAGVPIIGLYAKGEDLGLMRKMVGTWYSRYTDILEACNDFKKEPEQPQQPYTAHSFARLLLTGQDLPLVLAVNHDNAVWFNDRLKIIKEKIQYSKEIKRIVITANDWFID